jgi:hypothetical protein
VDGAGSGLCPVAGFGLNGVEPSGYATRAPVKYLGNYVVVMTGGCTWLRIASSDGHWR